MKLLQTLFGKFSWEIPSWMKHLCQHPKKCWGSAFIIILLIAAIFTAYCWVQSLPKPERVMARITAPKLTPLDKILVPDPLMLEFGVLVNGEFNTRSVAPLDLVGKEIADGIRLIHPCANGLGFR